MAAEQRDRERGEREGKKERKMREIKNKLTNGPHCHMASTSAKQLSKTTEWPNVNGFDNWMVKDTRF